MDRPYSADRTEEALISICRSGPLQRP